MKFVMNRDYVLASRYGHSVRFVKGEPTHVSPLMHKEAIAAGAVAHDGEVEFETKKVTVEEPGDPAARAEALRVVCETLKATGARESFGANGSPKVKVVSKMLGFDVDAREVAEAWAALKQEGDE